MPRAKKIETLRLQDITKTDIQNLLKIHRTVSGAAEHAGVTRVTFGKWMKRYKVKKPRSVGRPSNLPPRSEIVRRLNAEDATRRSVATSYGISEPGLQKWLTQLSIKMVWA